MRVRVEKVRDGLHPSEVVVAVQTIDGPEFMTIDRGAMAQSSVEIGYPIREKGDQFLIELPRETMTGSWRVWVRKDSTVHPADERIVA